MPGRSSCRLGISSLRVSFFLGMAWPSNWRIPANICRYPKPRKTLVHLRFPSFPDTDNGFGVLGAAAQVSKRKNNMLSRLGMEVDPQRLDMVWSYFSFQLSCTGDRGGDRDSAGCKGCNAGRRCKGWARGAAGAWRNKVNRHYQLQSQYLAACEEKRKMLFCLPYFLLPLCWRRWCQEMRQCQDPSSSSDSSKDLRRLKSK